MALPSLYGRVKNSFIEKDMPILPVGRLPEASVFCWCARFHFLFVHCSISPSFSSSIYFPLPLIFLADHLFSLPSATLSSLILIHLSVSQKLIESENMRTQRALVKRKEGEKSNPTTSWYRWVGGREGGWRSRERIQLVQDHPTIL